MEIKGDKGQMLGKTIIIGSMNIISTVLNRMTVSCHPERSEGSDYVSRMILQKDVCLRSQMLHCVQHDMPMTFRMRFR